VVATVDDDHRRRAPAESLEPVVELLPEQVARDHPPTVEQDEQGPLRRAGIDRQVLSTVDA
jgi:hypothetical protein